MAKEIPHTNKGKEMYTNGITGGDGRKAKRISEDRMSHPENRVSGGSVSFSSLSFLFGLTHKCLVLTGRNRIIEISESRAEILTS